MLVNVSVCVAYFVLSLVEERLSGDTKLTSVRVSSPDNSRAAVNLEAGVSCVDSVKNPGLTGEDQVLRVLDMGEGLVALFILVVWHKKGAFASPCNIT